MNPHRPLERLEPLLASFVASDLTHFELRDGEFAVEFVRRTPPAPASSASVAATTSDAPSHPAESAAATESKAKADEKIIRAELVGVVRMTKPVLTPGTRIEREREVASIEALGVKTPIRCSTLGEVTRVLVDDGDFVDYGQALFVVERV